MYELENKQIICYLWFYEFTKFCTVPSDVKPRGTKTVLVFYLLQFVILFQTIMTMVLRQLTESK